MSRVVVLNTQSGDLVGIFVDGLLKEEGHDLQPMGSGSLLNLSEEFNFASTDVTNHELNDVDESEMEDTDGFPRSLSDLDGFWEYRE